MSATQDPARRLVLQRGALLGGLGAVAAMVLALIWVAIWGGTELLVPFGPIFGAVAVGIGLVVGPALALFAYRTWHRAHRDRKLGSSPRTAAVNVWTLGALFATVLGMFVAWITVPTPEGGWPAEEWLLRLGFVTITGLPVIFVTAMVASRTFAAIEQEFPDLHKRSAAGLH